ncbi:uncharacterized protein LOC131670269 [Phymastichus coffea]|uniref:uncharacterized protein LOC131670269 n=1 Tax=Phymastichus coffea TaxID=108790 RepID=UPI00273BC00E|nr:uncharacterized protein LOC131670269 [Phymastichus coffea]
MSESVRPSSSKTAMSIAFKRARRKFPKNFGLSSNRVEKESSEQDSKSTDKPVDPVDEKMYHRSIPEDVETGLIDSFKEVKLTEEPEIVRDQCQDQSENFVGLRLRAERPTADEREKCESLYRGEQARANERLSSLAAHTSGTTNAIAGTIAVMPTISELSSDVPRVNEIANFPADMEVVETPTRGYEETAARRKRQLHRCKKSSHRHSGHVCEDQRFELYSSSSSSSSCQWHEHCAHCQHYRRHCSCCRTCYCCCARCCLTWQDCTAIAREACPSCRRRRSKKKRCSVCNGKRLSSSPSVTCSRDSGIFTQKRYEDYDGGGGGGGGDDDDDDNDNDNDNNDNDDDNDNDNDDDNDYNDDNDDNEDASATLAHKDSLSILQEQYAKKDPSRDVETRRAKGKTACKRISSRYSYY